MHKDSDWGCLASKRLSGRGHSQHPDGAACLQPATVVDGCGAFRAPVILNRQMNLQAAAQQNISIQREMAETIHSSPSCISNFYFFM